MRNCDVEKYCTQKVYACVEYICANCKYLYNTCFCVMSKKISAYLNNFATAFY